eukprot:scaffold25923_cov105-Isochrysis_galbana.AAC.7
MSVCLGAPVAPLQRNVMQCGCRCSSCVQMQLATSAGCGWYPHTGSSVADTAAPLECVTHMYPHTGVSCDSTVMRVSECIQVSMPHPER